MDAVIYAKVYKFRVLLVNGLSLRFDEPATKQMPVLVFADLVREEFDKMKKSDKIRRSIDWDSADLCLIDIFEKRFKDLIFV